jgi:hypothetical protein
MVRMMLLVHQLSPGVLYEYKPNFSGPSLNAKEVGDDRPIMGGLMSLKLKKWREKN